MKRKLLLLFSLAAFQLPAQTIGTIQSIPANPTTADNILILVDCQFNMSSCNTHTQGHSFLTATSIGAWALHCLDTISTACIHTDTFAIGLLSAGNYSFNFELDEGHGLPTCTPGIVPGPNDNFNFTVSVPTSVEELEENSITVYPNPASNQIEIRNLTPSIRGEIRNIEIYNVVGEKIISQQPRAYGQQQIAINVSGFPSGIYFVQLRIEEKSLRKIFSVQR